MGRKAISQWLDFHKTPERRMIIDPYRFAAAGGSNGLLTDLKAYWKLDEASGSRADSHGSNTLTDNNTVTSATGKLSNGALFTAANTEWLHITDNANLSTGDVDFYISGWVKPTSASITQTIIAKGTEYALYISSGNKLACYIRDNYIQEHSQSISSATWYFWEIWFDSALNKVTLNVSTGSTYGTPLTSAAITPADDTTYEVRLGKWGYLDILYLDALLDEIYYRKGSIPDSTQRALLFGSGTPPDYSTFTT